LSRLQRLPFDNLKIDRSFIRELSTGNSSLDIVRAILQLAHSLKLGVVAEGVETEEQFYSLRQLGCDYMQGFLFSMPVDAEAAEEFYRQSCNGDAISLAFAGPRSIHVAGMGRRAASLDAEHL
jgi:EAL domain-containing protein (putative c-di-GMP-specific phosphodiesterase class I)